jgi:predicted hydrocarbon binding protein
MESLLGGRWDGIEAACVGKGDECCSFQLTRDGQWDSNLLPLIPRQEAEIVLTRFLDIALSDEKDFKRRNISNFQHISTLQALNYIILTRSAGHGVLLKYAGKAVGKRIAAEKKLHSTQAALKYLTNLFTDLKVGIMETDNREDCIVITLKESIMSAGVANIKAKLCGYIAGIIEGCIDAATDQYWVVEEEKCVAAGDPACVFSCSMRKTPIKQVLLIR